MPTNLYGPGDSYQMQYSHVLPAMIRKFHLGKMLSENNFSAIQRNLKRWEGESFASDLLERSGISANEIILWGSGQPRREFLYVDDLAEACIMLMERYHASEIGETINIGCGQDVAISSLAETIKEIIGYRGKIRWDTSKPDGMPRKLLDVSRIKSLDWQPTVDLREGIRRSYQWYREQTDMMMNENIDRR